MFINLINFLISQLGNIITGILSLLPDSPFTWDLGALAPYWSYVTVFIPIPEMITLTASYVAAVLLYMGIRWVLRFTKFIQ